MAEHISPRDRVLAGLPDKPRHTAAELWQEAADALDKGDEVEARWLSTCAKIAERYERICGPKDAGRPVLTLIEGGDRA